MGSATPKYIKPIPIPAANSIEIQEKKEYSGLLSLLPNRIFPYLLNIRYKRKITNMVTDHTYIQFRLIKMKFFMPFRRYSATSGKSTDMKETPAIKIILGKITPLFNVVLSICLSFTIIHRWLVSFAT